MGNKKRLLNTNKIVNSNIENVNKKSDFINLIKTFLLK